MELNGNIQPKGSLYGSFDFDQANYELLNNKPSINGVELIGNKTSEDLHIETGGGGGGGTNNYNNLENKPKVNGVILQDDVTLGSLGIQPEIPFSGDPTEYLNGNGDFTTPQYINYTTEEQNTGIKWMDGKDIFVITIPISNVNANLTTLIANSDITNIIKQEGYMNKGIYGLSIPYSDSGDYAFIRKDQTNINLINSNYFKQSSGAITIYYTK